MKTIQKLKMELENGEITSEQLVNEVIENHEKWLDKNAVASINPQALEIAKRYDEDIPKEDQPSYYLWRFMMAYPFQNKGYGKKVLDLIIDKARNEHQSYLYTSCEMEGDMPYQFYIKYGFIDTGINDGEQVLKFKL